MTLIERLLSAGFARVIVLDAAACGVEDVSRVVLALWAYAAEKIPEGEEAWIHPYYFASQKAYTAAARIASELAETGVRLRDDIRLKPIFARIPDFALGRNTLSRVEGLGSRFHVQTLTTQEELPVTSVLQDAPATHACGDCRRCMEACPTGAIDEAGFHRERCLRQWMMSGKPVPKEIRGRMGNRLIGCDECQRSCPHNPPPVAETNATVPLLSLLTDNKAQCEALRPVIGVNLTIPNRVLSQACLLAGCSGHEALLPALEALRTHPSPTVAEHADWAAQEISRNTPR